MSHPAQQQPLSLQYPQPTPLQSPPTPPQVIVLAPQSAGPTSFAPNSGLIQAPQQWQQQGARYYLQPQDIIPQPVAHNQAPWMPPQPQSYQPAPPQQVVQVHSKPLEQDSHPNNVYVAGVPGKYTNADLAALFAPFGEITSAKMMQNRVNERGRGIGFVMFKYSQSASNAIRAMAGTVLAGEPLTVRPARLSPPPAKQRLIAESQRRLAMEKQHHQWPSTASLPQPQPVQPQPQTPQYVAIVSPQALQTPLSPTGPILRGGPGEPLGPVNVLPPVGQPAPQYATVLTFDHNSSGSSSSRSSMRSFM